ncbi:MAG: CmcJ/NvfI family oxidoreductase [Alphaproteobacteria bacterium]|nr:CmcJ/NvfI family oxidoreductase [Alphaproteobacteria bacterium]
MTEPAREAALEGVRLGVFHYMQPSAESSLYRNGRVLTRRDRDGSDSDRLGVDLEERDMPILNARGLAPGDQPTLAANGFELLRRPMADPDLDFLDHDAVVRAYYPECADIVRAATGAATVAAFDHNIRSATGKSGQQRIAGGQQVQGPAHLVHGDYTLTSAPQRLRDLARPPTLNDTYRTVLPEGATLLDRQAVEEAVESGRFAIVNLWRNIAREPVATRPLALCDAASVRPEELVVFEIHYGDRVGENYFAKHDPRHRWVYWSAMTRDEALLIKQWDSAGELARSKGARADAEGADGPCTFSFHSAFEDPATPPDAPDRWSIEVRCAVLYG